MQVILLLFAVFGEVDDRRMDEKKLAFWGKNNLKK